MRNIKTRSSKAQRDVRRIDPSYKNAGTRPVSLETTAFMTGVGQKRRQPKVEFNCKYAQTLMF